MLYGKKGRDIRLSLTGPYNTGEAEWTVEEALKSSPGLIEHLGGVYGERKAGYFHSIDCFLFPARNELVDSTSDSVAASNPTKQRDDYLHCHAGEELEHLVARICSPVQA